MPFTQDSDLELLFDPSLIPNEIRITIHSDLHIRPLAIDDHKRGHLDVLKVLSKVSDPGFEAYKAHFKAMRAPNPEAQAYFVLALVDKATDRMVGTGSIFIEKKFLRGLGSVGHIEDMAVIKEMQGKKLGLRLVQTLTSISEKMGCYKTILNCSDDNIPFYEKCGFSKKENEMAKYATETHTSGKL